MAFIVNYLEVIAAILSIIVIVIISVVKFFKKSKTEQLKCVKEWLLQAVIDAEKELGSGTGKLKLRKVYDAFISRFPELAKHTSFEKFSELVDSALSDMNTLLASNTAIQSYVGGIYIDKIKMEG